MAVPAKVDLPWLIWGVRAGDLLINYYYIGIANKNSCALKTRRLRRLRRESVSERWCVRE